MVAWRNDGGQAGNPVDEGNRGRVSRRARGLRLVALGLLALLVLLLAAAWLSRRTIADNVIAKELEKRGVTASYHLDRIGLRTQVVSNLVIGDPKRPDLVARKALIQMRVKLDGSIEVYRVVARGVRLQAELGRDGRVRFGQVDKLLPPPSGKPFTLPNLVVDLADATIALGTPYGRMGFALVGRGNLSGGFKGRLAASAPRLDPGACALDRLKANLAIAVEARHPRVMGPVSADRFGCPASRIAIVQPRMEINSRFAEGFDRFDGSGKLSAAQLTAGSNGLANMTSTLTFVGEPTDMMGKIDLAAQQARLAAIGAARTRLNGRYRLDASTGRLSLVADFASSGSSLAPAIRASLTEPLRAARKSPLGPIATAIGDAIARVTSDFEAAGRLVVANFPGGGGVRIEEVEALGPRGARVAIEGGDGLTYYWPSGKLRLDGRMTTGGGGLPDARIALRQRHAGAPLSGEADVAPYAAGGARMALAPVRFGPATGGATRVQTVALLDGPFPSGRVAGLRLPIDARFGGRGGLVVGEGCIEARFAALQAGSLRLGPARIPLCPTGPAILVQRPGGKLAIGMATRNLALRGRLGSSPFALDAGRAEFIGQDHFAASGLALRLGRADSPVLIDAGRVDGTFAGSGVNGRFSGAEALIGKVPLSLTDASGRWTVKSGDLAIDGALTVSDRNPDPRFYPLRSEDVRFTLAGGRIAANGTLLHPDSGTRVGTVAITHQLSNGNGEAIIDVPGIRFAESGLQPEMLTRLSEGVIALVNGSLDGQGRIAWNGDGKVTSTGEFNIRSTDLAASFGPVTGINTTVRFTDLLGLETAPGQSLTMTTINPGILVEAGEIRYQLLPGQLVKIERGEWPFMGGRIILQETILNFAKDSPKRLTFEVVGLDAHTFVSSMGFKDIDATGIFDGVLPMIFDEQGGRIVGGRLDSREGGGLLMYNGIVSKASLGTMGKLAFDALKHLRYRSMIVRLDGNLDGEFATRLTIDQVALGETTTAKFLRSINKVPFKFNVAITGPFRALIATAKSFRDPQPVISDVLPVPLDQIPGVVTEVRRHEEDATKTQTPVDQEIEVAPPGTKP